MRIWLPDDQAGHQRHANRIAVIRDGLLEFPRAKQHLGCEGALLSRRFPEARRCLSSRLSASVRAYLAAVLCLTLLPSEQRLNGRPSHEDVHPGLLRYLRTEGPPSTWSGSHQESGEKMDVNALVKKVNDGTQGGHGTQTGPV
jgi:hypothetical protein